MALADVETELPLPCPDAVIAGTLALMTVWADTVCAAEVDLAERRIRLARKIVSNLVLLQHHPRVSPALRQVMCNAHGHWVDLVRAHDAVRGTMPIEVDSARVH